MFRPPPCPSVVIVLAATLTCPDAFGEGGLVEAGADEARTIHRIGLAGCHRQDQPAPALWRYVQAEPDLMLCVGDNVYADTETDIAYLHDQHAMLASLPAFQKLKSQAVFAATWDDHDYGLNNFGKDYPLRDASRRVFREFWDAAEFIPDDRDGVYHARYFGEGDRRLQILLLDGRYNRDDEGDASDTLGEAQWAWLAAELEKPAALRLVVNGYQFLLDRNQKMETWSKFPAAQRRLFDTLCESGAEGIVFIAGDQHYGEVSRWPGAIGYDAIEFMFSGVNQEEPHVFSTKRVSPVAHAKHAYALMDIVWRTTETDEPHVVFRAFDADTGAVELTYRGNFSELKTPRQMLR